MLFPAFTNTETHRNPLWNPFVFQEASSEMLIFISFQLSQILEPTGTHSGTRSGNDNSLKENVEFLKYDTRWNPLEPILEPIRFQGSL